MDKVIPLFGYGVHEFYWGQAIREERTKKWTTLIMTVGNGEIQEWNIENLNVIVHENGIEFIS